MSGKLYCPECGNYLLTGSGDLVDCSCGWRQPTTEEEDGGFEPDWVSPPGDTIADIMSEQGLKLDVLAGSVGLSVVDMSRLVAGNLKITPGLAQALSVAIGSTPDFWLNREMSFRQAVARLGVRHYTV